MSETLILIVGICCFGLTVLGIGLTIYEFNKMQK